jgi:hypothetical protein
MDMAGRCRSFKAAAMHGERPDKTQKAGASHDPRSVIQI